MSDEPKLGVIRLENIEIRVDQASSLLAGLGGDELKRLAMKFGGARNEQSARAGIAEDLQQVRQVLQLVESALVMQEALGQEPMIQPNTVRNELVLLNRVIAKLNGAGEPRPPRGR